MRRAASLFSEVHQMAIPLNRNITILLDYPIVNSKASEVYVSVRFTYADYVWEGYVPIEYRRNSGKQNPMQQPQKNSLTLWQRVDGSAVPVKCPETLTRSEEFRI